MKNLKKLLAVIVAICVLATFTVPAFAAEDLSEEVICETLGVVEGTGSGVTADYLASQPARYQGAIMFLRLKGLLDEAKAFTGTANFSDLEGLDISNKVILAYLYANPELGFGGIGNDKFAPLAPMTAKEYYKVMLVALGYEYGVDFTWDNVFSFAVSKGLMKLIDNTKFTINDLCIATVEALKATVDGGTKNLATTLAEADAAFAAKAVTAGLYAIPVEALTVESVAATNLKEVVVTFNKAIDKDTVVAANFKLNKSLTSTPTLLEDGKTVVVAVTPVATGKMANQTAYTLTVDAVKSVDGIKIAKVVKDFTAFDATLPTVAGLKFTGPKNLEIEFSEPMESSPTVSVKAGNSTLSINASGITGKGTNVLTVPLFSTLVDGTTYTISITDSKDFAGYVNVIKTIEAVYTKDITPPTAAVTKTTQEYVVVEFNKPVSGLDAGLFSHTFTAWKASKLTATDSYAAAAVTSGTKFYVWFNGAANAAIDRPIAQGSTSLTILAKTTSPAAEIVDLWGNKFAEVTLPITVTADTTAPEVKEIKIASDSSMTVEFTKNVSFAVANIEVLDSEGKAISGVVLSVTAASEKKYTVNFGKSLAGKTIIVNIKNVKDTTLMTNAMPLYSTTITVTDSTAPTISKVTYDATDKYLYVFFSEDMDSETALVKGNYQFVNGTTFTKLATDPVFVNGIKTVRFELNATQQALVAIGTTTVLVDNAKDVAGNVITAKLSAAIAVHAASVIPVMTKAEATATDKVVVTYGEELAIVDMAAYQIGATTPVAMDVALVDGKTQLTFTLNSANPLAADTIGVAVSYVNAAGAALIKNLFNVSPAAAETFTIIDKIKPALITDTDAVKAIRVVAGKIEIEFTEALGTGLANLYAQDLVIVKGTKTLVAGVGYTTTVSGNTITVADGSGAALAADVYKVSSKEAITYIQDTHAVKAAAFTTAKEVTVE